MDAEGEMDTGEDAGTGVAASVEVGGGDVAMRDVAATELSDGYGVRWDVGQEEGVVGIGEPSVGDELNVHGNVSISTGDYLQIDDHEMDAVLMNGAIDECAAGESFGRESREGEPNLLKDASELGAALDRYVLGFEGVKGVANDVDCLKDEPLEVFEDANEFGFEQSAEETEFENFVRAEEAFEASRAPGSTCYTVGAGESLHFQELLADSEGEEGSEFSLEVEDVSEYNQQVIAVPEAGSSPVVTTETHEGLFYGQVCERTGREDASHCPLQPQEILSKQLMGENQAVDTSDYASEIVGGSEFEPDNFAEHGTNSIPVVVPDSLVCNVESSSVLDAKEVACEQLCGPSTLGCVGAQVQKIVVVSDDVEAAGTEVTNLPEDVHTYVSEVSSRHTCERVVSALSHETTSDSAPSSGEKAGSRMRAMDGPDNLVEEQRSSAGDCLKDAAVDGLEAGHAVSRIVSTKVGVHSQLDNDVVLALKSTMRNENLLHSPGVGESRQDVKRRELETLSHLHQLVESSNELTTSDLFARCLEPSSETEGGAPLCDATNGFESVNLAEDELYSKVSSSLADVLKSSGNLSSECTTVVDAAISIGEVLDVVTAADGICGSHKDSVRTVEPSLSEGELKGDDSGFIDPGLLNHADQTADKCRVVEIVSTSGDCELNIGETVSMGLEAPSRGEPAMRMFHDINCTGTRTQICLKPSSNLQSSALREDIRCIIAPALVGREAPGLGIPVAESSHDGYRVGAVTGLPGAEGKRQSAVLFQDVEHSQSTGKEKDFKKEGTIVGDKHDVKDEALSVSEASKDVQSVQPPLQFSKEEEEEIQQPADMNSVVSERESPGNVCRVLNITDRAVRTNVREGAEQGVSPFVEGKDDQHFQGREDLQDVQHVQSKLDVREHQQVHSIKVDASSKQVKSSRDIKSFQRVQASEEAAELLNHQSGGDSMESPDTRKGRDDTSSRSILQEVVGVPLWVKWRGKWQPGIQCCTIDCPPATVKAKPSYSKKHYIVVYSPTARNYSWVDSQHTLPISESPTPLHNGTHESGRETVKDLYIARRRMMIKLGAEMLDISDQLHVKAVVESARDVNAWKDFASEAAAAKTYAELGTKLIHLHLAIVREYIKPSWMSKRYGVWKEECVRAESASKVQKLTKELHNAVLWDDVTPLWNEPGPELDPQWFTWKGEAFEEKDTDPDGKAKAKSAGPSESEGAQGKQVSSAGGSKRFKEQARARRQRPGSSEGLESTPSKRSKLTPRSSDDATGSRAITAFRSPLVHPSGVQQNQLCVPVLEADRCHEVISADTLANMNGQLALIGDDALTQAVGSGESALQLAGPSASYHSDASEGDESKVFDRIGKSGASSMAEGLIALESGLCSAYLKNKGRRCNRFSKKEGVKYCEKHIYLLDPESAGKKLASDGNLAWQSGLCSAFLRRENRRCARQAKEGFNGYCGFHVHLGTVVNERNGEDIDSSKGEEGVSFLNGASVKEDRCQGITTRGVQCTHRTKDGSSFCVKHSSKGASLLEKDENKAQTPGASTMDWQTENEHGSSLASQGQLALLDAPQPASDLGSREVPSRTREIKHTEGCRGGSEGSTRKRKALSSFFIDRAIGDLKPSVPAIKEAISPKFSDGRTNQWTQCKGRTTRNEEQCSFRAREGFEYCSKHMISMEAKKKFAFQRNIRKEEVTHSEMKGSSNLLGARNLLNKFLKDVGGINLQNSASDAGKQLVLSTKDEAIKDGTAEELTKLVTAEMTKIQMFLQPIDKAEQKRAELNLGVSTVGSSSQSLLKAAEGTHLGCSLLSGSQADDHKLTNDGPVPCGLCDVEFLSLPDLGRHWRFIHKKEISLFIKGHACRVCDRLYTRKQTVVTHWKKRHPATVMTCPDLSVCFACDLRYADDDELLEHVLAVHPYQLSNPALKEMIAQNRAIIVAEQDGSDTLKCSDCLEEFDTHLGLYQHCEKMHKGSEFDGDGVQFSSTGEIKPGESNEGVSLSNGKYVCRLCGMTFPMLPDLGRHHQAAHMLCSKLGPVRGSSTGKKEASLETGRMKLPIRRKGEEKVAASEPGFGPTRRRRKKLRFTSPSQKKSLERDTKGPDALRLHVKAVLQGATFRKQRNKKQLGEHSSGQTRKDISSSTKPEFFLRHENVSNSSSPIPDEAVVSTTRTAPSTLSLTRRVESSFESVQEKFKVQADKIFTDFSQLHGETSMKDELQADGNFPAAVAPVAPKICMKEDLDEKLLAESKSEKLKLPIITSNSIQEQPTDSESRVRTARFITTCEDLSYGQEPVPIVCVIDQDLLHRIKTSGNKESSGIDTYQPSSFTYITRRRLDPSLGLDTENYKIGCTCGEAKCTPQACDHVDLFDNDNAEACDIYGKPMRGRFPYDDQGCIILEEGYLVYECNSSCRCQQTCQNRVLQKGVTVKLEVFKTEHKGWAVRAAQTIKRGTFVCEYVGEVLRDQEANKRGERYDQVGCSYLYDIDAHLDITGTGRRLKPFVIDATRQGNVARFINHSCAPNLVNYQVLVESMDCQLAHIGLFASRDIEVGEELAYDYRYRLLPGKGCPCHCGARNCRGRLY